MSDNTGINWTDATWNPIRGCSRVSPGCENCYAEAMATRFSGPGMPYEGLAKPSARGLPKWTGEVRFVEKMLDQPLRWKKPRRIFVNSMSDLFHEKLSNEQIAAIFGVMAAASRHTFQVLTKRPERMREWFKWIEEQGQHLLEAVGEEPPGGSPVPGACATFAREKEIGGVLGPADWREAMRVAWPLPNVHLGVTAEDQQRLNERVPILLNTPAAVRWVSAEPLLGPLDLAPLVAMRSICNGFGGCDAEHDGHVPDPCPSCGRGCLITTWGDAQAERLRTGERTDEDVKSGSLLSWVVVGGESGPRARPFDLEWARSIVAQCETAGVPVWVKQLGVRPTDMGVALPAWPLDRSFADLASMPTELRVREFPEVRP